MASLITNLPKVEADLDAWLLSAVKRVTDVTRGLSVVLFKGVLRNSPQFSGDFTANWKYALNTVDASFTPNVFPDAVGVSEKIMWGDARRGGYLKVKRTAVSFIAGSSPAINHAMAANKGKAAAFRLGDTINISNSAYHDEAYAMLIEDNAIKFRPGNTGVPARRAAATLLTTYANMSEATADTLARMKI